MDLQTFQYRAKKGWSIETFPDLDSPQTLILIFAAPEFIENPAPIKELARYYPKSNIIGCSSAGEIAGPYILDNSLSVAIIRFEKTPIELIKAEIKNVEDSFNAGQKIAKHLNKSDLRGIFVLSDGLQVNGSELIKGLNTIVNKDVIITGGLAADGKRFKQTWSIFNGEIYTGHAVAVGFYGDHIQIGHAARGGWDIFGVERRITRSKNNVLYELDERPALALYKEYLGEMAAGLPATGLLFPLAIRKDAADSRQLVRTILAVDEKEQSLTFAGDMPMGYLAQMMHANFDRLIDSASQAGELAIQRMPLSPMKQSYPLLVIAISCVGRRLLLGERTEEETEALLEILPFGSQQLGFYAYGEISPYTIGDCDLHNQSMTLTTLYEK